MGMMDGDEDFGGKNSCGRVRGGEWCRVVGEKRVGIELMGWNGVESVAVCAGTREVSVQEAHRRRDTGQSLTTALGAREILTRAVPKASSVPALCLRRRFTAFRGIHPFLDSCVT